MKQSLRDYFSKMGKKGGKKGGPARWKGVPAAERSALARKAVQARWKRRRTSSVKSRVSKGG